jgi:hypothetical protein
LIRFLSATIPEVNGLALQPCTTVTALLPVLSRVPRLAPIATPGSALTTAVHPDVAEPCTKLLVATASSYLAAAEELLVHVLAAGRAYCWNCW